MNVWLVLCDDGDEAARWAYAGLGERGLAPLELVTAGALAHAARWSHHVSTSGSSIEVTLADGRHLRSRDVVGTLNRLGAVWNAGTAWAVETDRSYAAQEFYAFCVSWLRCLPGATINRPACLGLGGRWRHPSEWAVLAGEAGLALTEYRMPDPSASAGGVSGPQIAGRRTVVVVGDAVFGVSPDHPLARSCRRLARRADADLLGVDLVVDPAGTWRFAGATPCPDLRIGGAPLLDTLTQMLAGRAAAVP
jgi:hypothetical protein